MPLSKSGTLEQCSRLWYSNASYAEQWGYHGATYGFENNPANQITYAGCLELCGTGSDYYSWDIISVTLTTWILPIIGVLLQGPFESNQTLQTILLIARWMGSPIVSLSYTLWNIKAISKCAVMVDMSMSCTNAAMDPTGTAIETQRLDHYQDMRNSLYILSAMNQFSMRERILYPSDSADTDRDVKRDVETLLRMALFSKDIELRNPYNKPHKTLQNMRRKLARDLRQHRRRAIVPVFVSTMWFLFALVLSIQAAFGDIGANTTAHDMGIGLLMAFLPVLIVSTIVDRNFVATDRVIEQLNKLVNAVIEAWTPEVRCSAEERRAERLAMAAKMDRYLASFAFESEQNREQLRIRAQTVSEKCSRMKNLFESFAGQGRVRWHYGCAHSILKSIEKDYIGQIGRPWLMNESHARNVLVLGQPEAVPFQFDKRDVVQIVASILVVLGTIFGAFIISYFTPTVGLGCRSGGYIIYAGMAVLMLAVEFLAWPLPVGGQARRVVHYILRTAECVNAVNLCYEVMSQTTGAFQQCQCLTSSWTSVGGYIDWTQYAETSSPIVQYSWPIGMTLGMVSMVVPIVYVTIEWCLQSHLSTQNYEDAQRGLRAVRRFRRVIRPFRHPFQDIYDLIRRTVFHSHRLQVLYWEYQDSANSSRYRESIAHASGQPLAGGPGLRDGLAADDGNHCDEDDPKKGIPAEGDHGAHRQRAPSLSLNNHESPFVDGDLPSGRAPGHHSRTSSSNSRRPLLLGIPESSTFHERYDGLDMPGPAVLAGGRGRRSDSLSPSDGPDEAIAMSPVSSQSSQAWRSRANSAASTHGAG